MLYYAVALIITLYRVASTKMSTRNVYKLDMNALTKAGNKPVVQRLKGNIEYNICSYKTKFKNSYDFLLVVNHVLHEDL